MRVTAAIPADIPAWLDLALEVEPLFGRWSTTPISAKHCSA